MSNFLDESSYDFMNLQSIVDRLNQYVTNNVAKQATYATQGRPLIAIEFNGKVYNRAEDLARELGINRTVLLEYSVKHQLRFWVNAENDVIKLKTGRPSIKQQIELGNRGYKSCVFRRVNNVV